METQNVPPLTIRITEGDHLGYWFGFKNVFGPGATSWRPTKKMAIAAASRRLKKWEKSKVLFNKSEYLLD